MQIKEFIKQNTDSFLTDLRQLLMIPSVKQPALPGQPFGENVYDALICAGKICERLGFTFHNLDGYIGYIDYDETNKNREANRIHEVGNHEVVGVLVHMDVVPAEGFTLQPFGAQIIDGKIYGRGAIDNKGPALAALYALAALKEMGFAPDKRIRLIFGCDEESGWGDIDYYKQHEPLPDIGFSPDGDYPVVNAEKGILQVQISGHIVPSKSSIILNSLTAGVANNVLPHLAACTLSGDTSAILAYCAEYKSNVPFEIVDDTSSLTIRFTGQSAHASIPETGVSAIAHMLKFLSGLTTDKSAAIHALFARTGFSFDGEGFNIKLSDEISGSLTACMTGISLNGDTLSYILDIRYPVSYKEDSILTKLENTLSSETITVIGRQAPHYVPETASLVQTLLSVYHDVTGEPSYCKAVGGGTYARAIPNAVTFGARFPNAEEVAHQPDEYAVIDELLLNIEIIAEAVRRLAT